MSEEKKNEILEEKLDTEELEAVSGGRNQSMKGPENKGVYHHGGCSSNYYKQKCAATVEHGSWCHRDDWCTYLSEEYSKI